MLDDRTRKYLNTKKEGTRKLYRSSFRLFEMYAKKEPERGVTGSDLIQLVARDRRRDVEDRRIPEVEILKRFFNWMCEEPLRRRRAGGALP